MTRRDAGRLLVASATAAVLRAHTYHFAVVQVDHNTQSRRLEFVVTLHADDLQEALRRRTGRPIEIDRAKDAEALVQAYVRDRLELRNPDGKPAALKWVGMEVKLHFVTIYLEATAPPRTERLTARADFFFDLFADQVNALRLRRDGFERLGEATFRPGDKFRLIE